MNKPLVATLLGGLVAGTLDIIYAFIVFGPLTYGLSPQRVLQSVAAGWLGRESATAGGINTALLGLGTHFMIATVMAGVFVVAALAMRALLARPLLWGLLYGLVLWVAMNYVVVPLSATGGHFPADLGEAAARLSEAFGGFFDIGNPYLFAGTILTHTVLVGVPIALIARRVLD